MKPEYIVMKLEYIVMKLEYIVMKLEYSTYSYGVNGSFYRWKWLHPAIHNDDGYLRLHLSLLVFLTTMKHVLVYISNRWAEGGANSNYSENRAVFFYIFLVQAFNLI
jgi:hypothetical protein